MSIWIVLVVAVVLIVLARRARSPWPRVNLHADDPRGKGVQLVWSSSSLR